VGSPCAGSAVFASGSAMALPVGKIVCVGRNYAEHAREHPRHHHQHDELAAHAVEHRFGVAALVLGKQEPECQPTEQDRPEAGLVGCAGKTEPSDSDQEEHERCERSGEAAMEAEGYAARGRGVHGRSVSEGRAQHSRSLRSPEPF